MFAIEDNWLRVIRRSRAKAVEGFNVNGQHHWKVDQPSDAKGVGIFGRSIFAQNDSYLEMCNPGWKEQGTLIFGLFILVPFALFIIWMWYGLALHPVIFGRVLSTFNQHGRPADAGDYLFGWILLFPVALGAACLLIGAFYYMGSRTLFFTYLRGRIRFNRLTRKVYVLRPKYCGGNKVFDWDRLVALCDVSAGGRKSSLKVLALYHPPFDPTDQPARGPAKGEDCIFVGDVLPHHLAALPLGEYIRRYMQEGPTIDKIPPDAPEDYKQIPRFVPPDYCSFAGEPAWEQYELEVHPGFGETLMHMLGQMTCRWPQFPKEWNSDSGVGEPEDRPVQAGATMTALVYRAKGRLSAEDELAFLKQWGTAEALAEMQPGHGDDVAPT